MQKDTVLSSTKEKIIYKVELLKQNNGIMPYNYKSDAQPIKEVFSMSKKEFKRSLTSLKEANKIRIEDSGIYLMSNKL